MQQREAGWEKYYELVSGEPPWKGELRRSASSSERTLRMLKLREKKSFRDSPTLARII